MATYTEIIKSYNPLGFWRLDEAAGNAINLGSEGSGSDGTYVGTPTRRGGLAVGNTGNYPTVLLDGSSQRMSIAADVSFSVSAFTMIAWIKTTSTAGSSGIVNRDNGGDERPFKWRLNNGYVQFIDRGSANVFGGGRSLNDGLPHMVAFTYQQNDLKLYADGVLDGSATSTTAPSTASTTAMDFGSEGAGAYFAATIGYVAYFTSILTAAQIREIYLAANDQPYSYSSVIERTPGLVGYWPLNETSGTAAAGYGTAGNGAYTGTPTLNQAGPSIYLPTGVGLNATGQYVTTSHATNYASAVSVEAWIRPDAQTDDNGTIIALREYYASATAEFPIALVSNTDAKVGLLLSQGNDFTTDLTLLSAALDTTGRWYHVVGTFTTTSAALFVDGIMVTSGSTGWSLSSSSKTWRIGSSHYYAAGTDLSDFKGRIAHAAIYNRALTAAEILDHYRMGTHGRAGLTVY